MTTSKLSDDDLLPIAGGGLLHRRLLLKSGLIMATAAAAGTTNAAEDVLPKVPENLASPSWMHKTGLPFSGYGKPSKHEARTLRNVAQREIGRASCRERVC